MRTVLRDLLVAACLAAPCVAEAQGPRPAAAPAGAGGAITVSVLTIGPGDMVFERFGHNALRVRDASSGTDLAYNWGMFTFEDPDFIRRFLSGDTRYWVEAFPSAWLIDMYRRQDRAIDEQVLALTPEQAADLAAFVRDNVREERKFYRYDYFLDNCSTRLRDALDRALGGSLARRFQAITSDWSFRSEAVRLTTPDGLAQAGIDVALGPKADTRMSAWEAMYIPMRLRDYLREVTVPAGAGTVPLVASESVLHAPTDRAAEPAQARGLTIGAWGLILGAWMLMLAPFNARTRRITRVPAAVMAGLWYVLTGILGLALLGMWLGSAHVFWYRNLNLLLLSPLGLAAAVPVVRAILRGSLTPLARGLWLAVLAMALLAVLLSPFVAQRLGGPLLLLLPAHIGLAIAVRRHTRPFAAPAS